jgi:hypothetical protein
MANQDDVRRIATSLFDAPTTEYQATRCMPVLTRVQ